jgi:hypothetical protein
MDKMNPKPTSLRADAPAPRRDTKSIGCEHGEVTLDRLERALTAISYAIMLDGPIYAPYLEWLEHEIAALHARNDVMSRARKYLDQAVVVVALKAIA